MELHLTHIIAIVSVVVFAILFAIKPQIKTYILYVLFCFPIINLRITDDSLGGLSVFDLVSFFTFIYFVRDFFELRTRPVYLFWFLFLIFFIVEIIGCLNSEFGFSSLVTVIKFCPIFIYSRFFIITYDKYEEFGSTCILALKRIYIFFLVFLLVQVCVGLDFTIYPNLASNVYLKDIEGIRYPGNFGDSQLHGQYLAMGSFLFLVFRSKHQRIRDYLLFVVSIVAIFLAGSRSAFAGFCVGSLFLILTIKRFRWFGIMISLLVLLYSWFEPQDGIFSRKKDLSTDYLFRESLWKDALIISRDYPILGVGLGNYKTYVEKYLPDQYVLVNEEFIFFDQPESGYLKLIVESGYLGFLLLFTFVFIPVILAIINLKNCNKNRTVLYFIAGIISFLVAFSTVYSIWDHRILIFFTTLLLLCLKYPTQKSGLKISTID